MAYCKGEKIMSEENNFPNFPDPDLQLDELEAEFFGEGYRQATFNDETLLNYEDKHGD
jgi:hypothetical protein